MVLGPRIRPTGDLTKFDPDQLTHDLDLGNATPEQFIEAMVQAGFMDKSESGTLRLHDWPDYTAKSLRPRFRKTPDRWHQVLRSYGLPIPQRRNRIRAGGIRAVEYEPLGAARIDCTGSAARQGEVSGGERNQHGLQGVVRVDYVEDIARQGVGSGRDRSQNALRAVRRISTGDSVENTASTDSHAPHTSHRDMGVAAPASSNSDATLEPAPTETFTRPASPPEDDATAPSSKDTNTAPIPGPLATIPTFTTPWWPKFLQMYQDKGCPLTTIEQTKVLDRLAEAPSTALQRIKKSFKNPMINLPAAQPAWTGAEAITNTS